jgi:hypothetical protein
MPRCGGEEPWWSMRQVTFRCSALATSSVMESEESVRTRALNVGGCFLTKPFDVPALIKHPPIGLRNWAFVFAPTHLGPRTEYRSGACRASSRRLSALMRSVLTKSLLNKTQGILLANLHGCRINLCRMAAAIQWK